MSHIQDFETQEAAGLAELDADLQAVAKSSAPRAVAILLAQQADRAESEAGRQEREAARMAAIEADSALRTGLPGRPLLSDERLAYRALCEAHEEAPDRFKLAQARYQKVIDQLKAAGPELDTLQVQADQQVALAKQSVKHLEQAASTFAQAVTLADTGKSAMAKLGGIVAFNDTPFIDLTASISELRDLHKRWKLRLDAEMARLGKDQAAELTEMRERRESQTYGYALLKAASSYRKTAGGKLLWKNYGRALREFEVAQAEQPLEDFSTIRDEVQARLTAFYRGAAEHGKLEFHADAVPQVG
ncbi:MAG TPA: hypothetical protein VM219_04820 [Phycisphaerae bacterium]|nr:hypothetical protein [Phycisphaerae bacterium]